MIRDARPAVAGVGARPARGEGVDDFASGSTVTRAGVVGPDRGGSSSPSRWAGSNSGRWASDSYRSVTPPVVHEFTAAWERGESPAVEDYLRRLDPDDVQGAVDLIYRAFCLAEADGRAPDADAYVARFPRYAEALEGLFRVHGACSPSLLNRLLGPPPGSAMGSVSAGDPGSGLPRAGDSIGPYRLLRELGRGSFARVFLAEQADLADRLVVVKVAARSTREPWLLARARHAHIVEILSHAEVDDGAFQLICMPFWGGATLADVLAAPGPDSDRAGSEAPRKAPGRVGRLRRLGRDRGPKTGTDLLAALDAVAAPEYPSVHPARPAREILAPLSYDRAIAWVIARLAEALDHAAARDVTHGDVKPSNILLSADGNPMLLDFNLARHGAPALDRSGRPIDLGGTLAYMAPERLRALERAGTGRSAAGSGADDAGVDDRSAHVADIYSLGMVLLEALSGRPPSEAPRPGGDEAGADARPAGMISAARAYAAVRERPARAIIADFEAASGRPIAPALRSILGQCLDPDPARRYRRAFELAEDLDRWRADRPLAFADEPFWGQKVPRLWRARPRKLIAAAISTLAVGLAISAVYLVGSNQLLVQGRGKRAVDKLEQKWDDPRSEAFLYSQWRPGQHFWATDDPEALDVACRVLREYGVIRPADVPDEWDWRAHDDFRHLPPADREDLEVWLAERGYRYGLAMADRAAAPEDWRQAMAIIDRLEAGRSIRAFGPLRDRLAARLGESAAPRPATPAPAWLDEHLLGFEAEARAGSEEDDARRRDDIERALGHYESALRIRPGSFWSHYRAATACFNLQREAEATLHLTQCVRRRPRNAEVQVQLAGRLFAIGQYPEALEHCDRALERAPHLAELYRTRAFARAMARQPAGVDEDVRNFEMFIRVLPPSLWGGRGSGDPLAGAGVLGSAFAGPSAVGEPPIASNPEEVAARAQFVIVLRKAELLPQALAELDKILVIRPDHIPSRIQRGSQAIIDRRFDEARSDLRVALRHPGLEEHVRAYPDTFEPLFRIIRQYLNAGRAEDARWVADCTRELAVSLRREVGKAEYHSAQVYAVLGRSDGEAIERAAHHLFRAFVAHEDFQAWYRNPNPWFDPVRTEIEAVLGRMEDPAAIRSRRLAQSSARPKAASP